MHGLTSRFTHCRTSAIHVDGSKLTPADVEAALAGRRGDVHEPQPGVLTFTTGHHPEVDGANHRHVENVAILAHEWNPERVELYGHSGAHTQASANGARS